MSSNNTTTSKNDIIERRAKRKREETQNNFSKINYIVRIIHSHFNSYEHEQQKDFFDFNWDRYNAFGSQSINEQFILDNLIEIIDKLETKFPGCKIRYIPRLKLASGKYLKLSKDLEYGIGVGTKINNSNWMGDIRSLIRIDWSESDTSNHDIIPMNLAFNRGFNPTVERKPEPAPGGFGGPAPKAMCFGSAGGKRSCSHTKNISFCHPVKRPRTNDNLKEGTIIHGKRQDMREKVLQKKCEREIAKLEANKEEVSKALDRLKN